MTRAGEKIAIRINTFPFTRLNVGSRNITIYIDGKTVLNLDIVGSTPGKQPALKVTRNGRELR